MKLFGKKNEENKTEPAKKEVVKAEEVKPEEAALSINVTGDDIISGFYISEKATLLNAFNQYVFRVGGNANKSQLKKQVEKMFNVKVKEVKILNTFGKTRNVGRRSGFKPGFKKAIVVLQKGYAIEQAKA